MRESWDMQFVESAAAALQALEKEPYDTIVSDMRMPPMDGADLLDQVKQHYPETVRMILSGQSSRGAVFRSIAPGRTSSSLSHVIRRNLRIDSARRLPCAICSRINR